MSAPLVCVFELSFYVVGALLGVVTGSVYFYLDPIRVVYGSTSIVIGVEAALAV